MLEGSTDEIPTEIIHGGLYKVRGNWFQGVVADLEICIRDGIIFDPLIVREVEDFMDEYVPHHDFSQRTTAEDIQKANAVIRKVLRKEEPKV